MATNGAARNIVLVGFMGSGKSTIGRALARRRGWRFVDTDEMVRQQAGGCDIPTLFKQEGEAAFRDRETEALRSVAAAGGWQRQVIATGGGTVLRPENVQLLRESGVVVWLTTRPEVVVARTARRAADRPLLASAAATGANDLLAHVLGLLGERAPRYQAAAHLVVDTSDRPVPAVVEEIHRKTLRWRGGASSALSPAGEAAGT